MSVGLRRPLLLLLAEQTAKANPDLQARLADPARRRFVAVLTAMVGLFLATDGLSQIVLARTVPTRSFVADSTAARIAVIGAGVIVTARTSVTKTSRSTDHAEIVPRRTRELTVARQPPHATPAHRGWPVGRPTPGRSPAPTKPSMGKAAIPSLTEQPPEVLARGCGKRQRQPQGNQPGMPAETRTRGLTASSGSALSLVNRRAWRLPRRCS